MEKHWVIVIAGPTGVGESTVTKALLEQLPDATRIVTTTSRPMRHFEHEGVDYHFISKEHFEEGIEQGEFLEHTYIANRDSYYGTKREDFERALRDHEYVLFNADKVGLETIKQVYPTQSCSLFIMYESIGDIRQRLLNRQPTMPPDELAKRLDNAVNEAEDRDKYDLIIVNRQGELEKTIHTALQFIRKTCA
jgi:guanylate kinase